MRRLDRLSVTGNMSKRPISAPLEDGLFELRGQAGNMQARLIYFFDIDKQIIFVHAIYKSGSQISRKDLEIAKQNRKLIKEEKEKANGLNLTH